MKKYIVIAILVTISILILNIDKNKSLELDLKTTTTAKKQLSTEEKVADFQYMYNILKNNYPYFELNKRQHQTDWLSNKDFYLSEIKSTTSDLAFYNTLKLILSNLNNGHTYLMDKNTYYEDKKIYENDSKSNIAWLNQLNKSIVVSRYSKMSTESAYNSTSPERDRLSNVTTSLIENHKIAYIYVKSFNSSYINTDMSIIEPFLKGLGNYKAIIIDIRGNTGGDDGYWLNNIVPMLINKPIKSSEYLAYRGGAFTENFVKCRTGYGYSHLNLIKNIDAEHLTNSPPELKKIFKYYIKNDIDISPKNSIGFKGKIYIITDGFNFSSSDEFANVSKSTHFATLVGQTTGGEGIGDGPAVCALPNSGFIFSFSKQMGLTSTGICNFEYGTQPDIKVDTHFGSSISNDQTIQKIIQITDHTS